MTPPSPTISPSDEAFEAEVRAMLARRAADVSPTPSARPGEDVLTAVAPPSPSRIVPMRRSLVAAAAAAVLVAGVSTYAVVHDTSPSVETSAGSESSPDPIIWPLGDHAPTAALAEPGDASLFYLSEVAGVDRPTLWPPVVEGDHATVPYAIGDVAGEVALRRVGDQWGVTSVSSDAVRIEAVGVTNDVDAADAAEAVMVNVVLGDPVEDGMALRTWSVDRSGTASTPELTGLVVVASEDGVVLDATSGAQTTLLLAPGDPSGETYAVEAPAGPQPPVAVRVDVLAPDDGDPVTEPTVVGHASVPVFTPGDDADQPGGQETASPTTTSGDTDRPPTPVVDAPGHGTPPHVTPPQPALWTSGQRGTAADAALAYLDSRMPERIAELQLSPGDGDEAATGGGVVVDVRWEIAGGSDVSGRYTGVIRLRDDRDGWSVVAATTDQIGVGVRTFPPGSHAVGVTIEWLDPEAIDGVEVTLLDGEGRPVSEDEYVLFATPGETLVPVADGADPADVRTVRLRHAGGTWFSLTELPVA